MKIQGMIRRIKRKKAEPTDEELLRAYQREGRQEALGDLYDRYVELVYGVGLKYLMDSGRAEDAVIGIYESLVEKLRTHRVDHFRSWLYVVARNYCLMELRREKRVPLIDTDPAVMHSFDLPHPDNEHSENEALLEALEHCLRQLAEKQGRCVRMFYFEEKSYKEIAETLALEVGSVRSHIQNGRRNLRICMDGRT